MKQPAADPSNAFDWDDLLLLRPASSVKTRSSALTGKRVLITGAGGSIGSALAHATWASAAESLILLDTSESGLDQVGRSLREAGCDRHLSILGSVCDRGSLVQVFQTHHPNIVLHAAAMKHVPTMEHRPFEAIRTNASGTLTLAKIAKEFQTEEFILVSTDKAADPVSIMGASKRIAELVLLATPVAGSTRTTVVRLGNVAGSQGSVIPIFIDQIAQGRPLTVTHKDAERYFITIDRAVDILLSSLEFPSRAALLIPELGQPVRILDLAHHLVKTRANCKTILFTGLRPGEKMTESLLGANERWTAPSKPSRGGLRQVASPVPPFDVVDAAMLAIDDAARSRDMPRMLQDIASLVPEYQPSSVLLTALALNQASPSAAQATA